MRLHRLSVTAFGPFRDEQVVDFDTLSDAGLFLLTGHTGAGKSSVLDAVAYALYGRVPGARASTLRVRSDHAGAAVPTTVELELTVRGARLRVRRTPDWDRPKKRGEGTTRQRGTVLLERQRGDGWEFVSSRHDEVGLELAGLVGMSHEQFCQVVLLPQGDFASFLCADAESRRRLLERLFGTERFSAVESWLGALRLTRGDALVQHLGRRSDLAARLAAVADDEQCPTPESTDEFVLAWADATLAALGVGRADAEARVAIATGHLAACEAELTAVRETDSRQRRLRDLRERERRLQAAAAQRATDGSELATAERAQSLGPLLETVDEAAETLDRAVAAVAGCRSAIARHGVADDGEEAALRARERDLRADFTRLGDLLDDATRLTDLDEQLAAVRAELSAARTRDADLRAALAAAPTARQALDVEVRRLEDVARPLGDLEPAVVRATGHAVAGVHRDDLAGRRRDAETVRVRSAHAVQAARERWLDLRERRLDGMAAELASALEPGAPCPVCGSPEHPAPAAAPASMRAVDDAAERAAQAALQTAEAVLARADTDARALADEHAAARLAAGGDEPVETLTATLAARTTERDASVQATAALPGARAALAQHDVVTDDHAATQRAAEQEVLALEVRDTGLRTERDALQGRLEEARGEDEDVPARVARLGAAADALAATVTALAGHAHAVRALVRAEQRLTRAAARAGFAEAATAAAALRPAERVTELSDAIADHDREVSVVAAGLAESDLVGLDIADPDETAARMLATRDAVSRADSARATAEGDRGRLAAAYTKALQIHPDLVGSVDRLGPVRASYETADELARLAAGTGSDNRLRMRLSYYVLSARLEQVAEAASERLLRMSDGRFTLRHTDVRAGGNQRSGLGLEVCDGWYGTTRDPSTLSGGESFMASLALALGLADVVVAEAGGTLMDTLFVDEGFGALDEETLDAVLDVLDGLREGGRAVGLVSHVAELRDRIPVKLEVRKAQRGSSLALSA